jgi:hypothetical protein
MHQGGATRDGAAFNLEGSIYLQLSNRQPLNVPALPAWAYVDGPALRPKERVACVKESSRTRFSSTYLPFFVLENDSLGSVQGEDRMSPRWVQVKSRPQ